MGSRRQSRELAMQALFYMDSRQLFGPRYVKLFCQSCPPKPRERALFDHIVYGVLNLLKELDPLIERFSSNWKLSRMSCVDRNVIRIAVFELLCCPDIPAKVSINEAIDIGKKFGTEESGGFINGILDSIRKALVDGEIDTAAFPVLPLGAQGEGPPVEPQDESEQQADPAGSQADSQAPAPKRPVRLNPRVMKRPRSNRAQVEEHN